MDGQMDGGWMEGMDGTANHSMELPLFRELVKAKWRKRSPRLRCGKTVNEQKRGSAPLAH